MNVTKNERGYALIIVLLLVVLITSMSAVFMRGAISNAKQGQRVDKNHLSVVSAEMGVDYYATSFTNRYYEVKDRIWETTVADFKAAMANKNFDGKVADLAKYYDDQMKKELKIAFDGVEDLVPPTGTSFKLKSEKSNTKKFKIDYAGNPIAIEGNIEGNYLGGKKSVLRLTMEFEAPSVLAKGSVEDVEVEDPIEEPKPKFAYKPFTIPEVELLPMISVNKDVNIDSTTSLGKKRSIIKKGGISVGQIQGYKDSVSLLSLQDIQSGILDFNKNIDIQTNDDYQTIQIQDNTGFLNIFSKTNYHGLNNFYNNENVTVKTDGTFQQDGIVEENDGFLTIYAKNRFQSKSLSKNNNTKVLTNGTFSTGSGGLIESNKNGLDIQSSDQFESGNLQYNNDVTIKTKGQFKSNLIIGNTSQLSIFTDGQFQSAKIQNNNNTFIQAKQSFTAKGVEANKSGISIYSGQNFHSTDQVQDNIRLDLYSGGNIQIDGKLYGNSNASIYSKYGYQSNLIQDNNNLKIVVLGNFQSGDIVFKGNSLICVGGNFNSGTISNSSPKDKSHVYVKGTSGVSKAFTTYLTKDLWEEKCGIEDFPIDEDQKLPVVDVSVDGGWKRPSIDVKYDPIMDSK